MPHARDNGLPGSLRLAAAAQQPGSGQQATAAGLAAIARTIARRRISRAAWLAAARPLAAAALCADFLPLPCNLPIVVRNYCISAPRKGFLVFIHMTA